MARPRKPVNYEEELMRIDAQITKWKNTIKELEDERAELSQQREQEEVSKLYDVYKASGLSIEEIITVIANQPA